MVKKVQRILLLILATLCLYSCVQNDKTKSEIQDSEDDSVSKAEETETTEQSVSVTIEESTEYVEYPTLDYEYQERTAYEYHKDVVSANAYFNVTEIEFPEIKGLKAEFWYMADSENLIVKLYEGETPQNYSETGLYNCKTGEYKTVLTGNQAEYNIVGFNEDYVIFSDMALDLSYETLWYYDRKNKTLTDFYDYAIYEDGKMYSYHSNSMLILDDTIYFDDYYKNDSGEVAVKLYSYNFKTSELKVVKDNAQNPMMYNDEVVCITFNAERGKYDTISSIDSDFEYVLSGNIFGSTSLKTNSNGIYAVMVDTFIDANNYGYSDYAALNLITEDAIISTNDPICDLSVTENFVCWSDYAGLVASSPCMYDITHDKIMTFDSIEECEYHFNAYKDCGLIVCIDKSEYSYYYFEYK